MPSLLDAFKQYINDAKPGGLLNPEVPPGGPTELAKGLLSFTPVVGDAISGYDAYQSAKQGNYGEAALNGLGLLPFVPSITVFHGAKTKEALSRILEGGLKKGGEIKKDSLAKNTASVTPDKNAAMAYGDYVAKFNMPDNLKFLNPSDSGWINFVDDFAEQNPSIPLNEVYRTENVKKYGNYDGVMHNIGSPYGDYVEYQLFDPSVLKLIK